jgi:type I restriction enzyme S subunit
MTWLPTKLSCLLTLEYGKALPRHSRVETGTVSVAGSNGSDGFHDTAMVHGPGIVVGRKGSAGKVTWFDSDFWPIDTTYFVQHDPRITNIRWLYYLLQSMKLERLNKTTGVPGLNRNDVYAESCLLPPPKEQCRMVELLDEADLLRRLRREADAKAARILPALFLKIFGDPATNSAGWPISTVGDVTTLVTSGSTPRGGAEVYVTEGPYIIRSQNVLMNALRLFDAARITAETHQQMSRTWVQEGDVLLNITGASIGRVAWVKVLDGPANVNQHVCIIRPDPELVNPAFLSACLSLPSMQSVINGIQTGASRQALNHVQVRGLKVPAPPVRIQRDFAFKAQILQQCIEHSEVVSRKLDRLWEAVIKQAFSGRLTAQWRAGHMQELLVEMTQQARALNLPMPRELEALS